MHPDQSHTHQHVTDDGGQNEERAETCVHEGVSSVAGLVAPPLQEAPGLRVLFGHLSEAQDRQDAEESVGDVDRQERQTCQFLVHIVIIEVGMVYSDVSFHRHGTNDAEPRQREEQHGESKVLAQRVVSGPRTLDVNGDGDRTGQHGAQQVRECQSTNQRVKSCFFLFFTGFTKNHDGDNVPDHPENEHDGWNGRDHGSPCHRLISHCHILSTQSKTSESFFS